VLGLVGPPQAEAQTAPPVIRLADPVTTLDEPFSRITGLRVLTDGRILVADPTEQALWRIDPATGGKEQLGRRGEGPGEYEIPGALFALPGDTTLMTDRVNRRLTMILPDGRLSTSTIPMQLPSGVPIFPRGVDAAGRIYFDLAGIMMPGLEEAAASGRAPLMRWDPRTDETDTLGYVNFPPMAGTTRPGEMRISMGGGGPFRGRDEWAVTPDGRVGIARFQEYRVEWLQARSAPVRGPTVPFKPVKITEADKDAWADQMVSQGIRIEIENGRRRVGRPPRPDVDRQEWPEAMPPFLAQAVSVIPSGQLVVARATAAEAQERFYDVFDASGRPVRQIAVPADRRIVGFGVGTVFVVRVDEDDLEWLEAYRM